MNIIINKHKFNILEKNIISDLLNVKQLINFIVRILIGYYYTNYWKIIFIAECGIEIFYYIKYNNDNTIDLSWNIIGFMTGLILKYYKTTDDKNKTINKSSNDNLSNNKACIDPSSEPIGEPVSDQLVEPVSDQVAEPVSEPAGEPIAVSEPVTVLVTKPVTEAVSEPVAVAVSDPVTEAVSEAVAEAVSDPVAEAVSDPVTEAVSEPVTEAVSEPVTETAVEQVAELVTKQTVNPSIEFFDTLTDKSIETNTNKSENQLLNVNSDDVDLQVVDIKNETKSYLKEMFESSDKKMRKMNETNKKHKKHKKSKRKNK